MVTLTLFISTFFVAYKFSISYYEKHETQQSKTMQQQIQDILKKGENNK
jgi:hypothetical protein